MVEADMYLGGSDDLELEGLLQNLHSLNHHHNTSSLPAQPKPNSKQWLSMVVIKDRDISLHNLINNHNNNSNNVNHSTIDSDDDFSIFPPSNHENLIPSSFSPDPPKSPSPPPPPSPPLSPLSQSSSSSSSDFDRPSLSPLSPSSSSSSSDFDRPSPPSAPSVLPVPGWWVFALQILRSRIGSVWSCFGYNCGGRGVGKGRVFWSLANLRWPALVVAWWLCARLIRRWRRRERVGHLLRIIREKDEKIIQLLNQIAQMNELLIARHKALTSK